jgi:hypothetical protein
MTRNGPVFQGSAIYSILDLAQKRGRCACGEFFHFWNLEQSRAQKAGIQQTYQAPLKLEGNLQGYKHEILLHAKGRGDRGGYDRLKGCLISWANPCFFCAGLL